MVDVYTTLPDECILQAEHLYCVIQHLGIKVCLRPEHTHTTPPLFHLVPFLLTFHLDLYYLYRALSATTQYVPPTTGSDDPEYRSSPSPSPESRQPLQDVG